eukprot:TRINITY_DN58962_c0_g1_i1.p1 TRINITY_DN58962_c0_g1~~TRINITY_DN58962_c0_g1_i1.p1  ORF type:complete len:1012 (-),score=193.16 TRINITY_DN58962_c0_g1_i1:138-3173(-)
MLQWLARLCLVVCVVTTPSSPPSAPPAPAVDATLYIHFKVETSTTSRDVVRDIVLEIVPEFLQTFNVHIDFWFKDDIYVRIINLSPSDTSDTLSLFEERVTADPTRVEPLMFAGIAPMQGTQMWAEDQEPELGGFYGGWLTVHLVFVVLGVLLGILLCCLYCWCCCFRKRRTVAPSSNSSDTSSAHSTNPLVPPVRAQAEPEEIVVGDGPGESDDQVRVSSATPMSMSRGGAEQGSEKMSTGVMDSTDKGKGTAEGTTDNVRESVDTENKKSGEINPEEADKEEKPCEDKAAADDENKDKREDQNDEVKNTTEETTQEQNDEDKATPGGEDDKQTDKQGENEKAEDETGKKSPTEEKEEEKDKESDKEGAGQQTTQDGENGEVAAVAWDEITGGTTLKATQGEADRKEGQEDTQQDAVKEDETCERKENEDEKDSDAEGEGRKGEHVGEEERKKEEEEEEKEPEGPTREEWEAEQQEKFLAAAKEIEEEEQEVRASIQLEEDNDCTATHRESTVILEVLQKQWTDFLNALQDCQQTQQIDRMHLQDEETMERSRLWVQRGLNWQRVWEEQVQALVIQEAQQRIVLDRNEEDEIFSLLFSVDNEHAFLMLFSAERRGRTGVTRQENDQFNAFYVIEAEDRFASQVSQLCREETLRRRHHEKAQEDDWVIRRQACLLDDVQSHEQVDRNALLREQANEVQRLATLEWESWEAPVRLKIERQEIRSRTKVEALNTEEVKAMKERRKARAKRRRRLNQLLKEISWDVFPITNSKHDLVDVYMLGKVEMKLGSNLRRMAAAQLEELHQLRAQIAEDMKEMQRFNQDCELPDDHTQDEPAEQEKQVHSAPQQSEQQTPTTVEGRAKVENQQQQLRAIHHANQKNGEKTGRKHSNTAATPTTGSTSTNNRKLTSSGVQNGAPTDRKKSTEQPAAEQTYFVPRPLEMTHEEKMEKLSALEHKHNQERAADKRTKRGSTASNTSQLHNSSMSSSAKSDVSHQNANNAASTTVRKAAALHQ